MIDESFFAGLGLALIVLVVHSLITTGSFGGVLITGDEFAILQELYDKNAIVEVCNRDVGEPFENRTCSMKLHPHAGFWINDIYNTCTYILPDGNIFFDGYCYPVIDEEPDKILEACVTGCELGVPWDEDDSTCKDQCQQYLIDEGSFS